jgi:glycosyltransferase involved in cell wall biosynthesis
VEPQIRQADTPIAEDAGQARVPSSHPHVSILTPSLEQAAWLPDNLHSVACQTYPHIEHIVIDGGSTDGTLDILRAAGGAITWRSEPDEGQADAINKAFRASSGEIIGWINSDDAYFDCRVVADVVAYFAAHPDVDVVYGHCLQVTGDGHAIQVLGAPRFDRDLQLAVNLQMQPSTFIRRSALTDPMLDATYHFAMDYELWLRLAARGARSARIDRLVGIDRHQPERKSSTIKHVNQADLERLRDAYGLRLTAETNAQRSAFYVKQRLIGARFLLRVRRRDAAFTAPADMKRGLLRRQLLQRRSTWPEEYR